MSNAKPYTPEEIEDFRNRDELRPLAYEWPESDEDRWLATLDAKQREVDASEVALSSASGLIDRLARERDEARRDLAAAEEVIGSAQDYLQHGRPERAKRDLDAYEWSGQTNNEEGANR